ncbi:ImmA/IrrE family metallo-endopeptidase [Sphingobium sp. JS3065]|uniref:ImmA/IrrE family metallo-endopeptidase n=1 Tax=Sphingobium sp. JS3065 TaxID=2970925 RepID=UPI0022647C13|nr:ImmA/IrrE family metallo-endopeptidase [Sphingobium sp. JS3065]UZW54975.1 ImmA/IrrE family metallo-endopeptidase [Sphingobium sp. JS3065]
MSGQNFIVPPRNWNAIEKSAQDWRAAFKLEDVAHTPITDMLEKVLDLRLGVFNLVIEESSVMGSAEGYTDPNGEFIMLREDVYRGACAGDRRDRFTAAHEFGHWAMHTNVPLARATSDRKIEPYRLSEPQANHFASALLMPAQFFSAWDTPQTVMDRHGVSYQAACHRLDYLNRKGMIKK